MSSIVIAHDTWSDAATLSGGSWTVGLPLNNLKTDALYQTARTTDAATTSTKMVADLGAAQAVDCMILGPGNLTSAFTVRVKGAPTNAFASGYDSGVLASGITAADIDPEAGTNAIVVFGSTQTYRWWSVEIDDHLNGAGYLEFGRLFLAPVLAPSINYAPGSNGLTLEDNTQRNQTLSMVESNGRRRNRRVFNFGIPVIGQTEALGNIYRFQRTAGFDKTLFLIPDPSDTANMQARAFWGRIGTMDPITQAMVDIAGVGMTVREVF